MRLWEAWRRFSDRVAGILAFCCGLFGVFGGAELLELGGPVWVAWSFIAFGAGLCGLVLISSYKNRAPSVTGQKRRSSG